jgi:hypothetical protein
MFKKIIYVTCLVAITACATDYPCGEPRAGRCSSVSNNIQTSYQPVVNPEDLPINPHEGCNSGSCTSKNQANSGVAKYPTIPGNGSPLVSTPSMMRVWVAPYIDSDNIFHEQNYQYLLVDRGRWLYGSNSVFGRVFSNNQVSTVLIQDSNAANNDNSAVSNNVNKAATQVNPNNNTPALNFLKQQDQASVSSMGLSK